MKYLNKSDAYTILHYLGMVMEGIGLMFVLPLLVSIIHFEETFIGFIIAFIISISVGKLLKTHFKEKSPIKLKHGMIISSIAWIWASLIGAIAIILSIDISFIDAFFESISCWTCTGFTLFTDVESLPSSILFLRCLQQWLGGLGIIVVVLGISFKSGTPVKTLYQSEARDEKIKPSIINTLHNTLKIYLFYTIIGIIAFTVAGMPVFDSVCNSLTNIATGGVAITNESIGSYNSDIISIISIFLMILGATSFLVHYNFIKSKGKSFIEDLQFKSMIIILTVFSLIIILCGNIVPIEAIYQSVSALTSTGSNITPVSEMARWPSFVLIMLVILMLIGGSSGSTVGSIKIIRFIILFKGMINNITSLISPKGRVFNHHIPNHEVSDKTVRESASYICLFLSFIFVSWAIFAGFGYDPLNSFFEVVSAQGNVGLTTGIVSGQMNPLLKGLLMFNMWIGRLEIIPVLVTIRCLFEMFKK